MYNWQGMRKMNWQEVNELARNRELAGYFLLYDDGTEAEIDADYQFEDIVAHYQAGGEFGEERSRLYVLHGYWNTPDADGIKIVAMAYKPEIVEKKLTEIVENNASEYVGLTQGNWKAVGGNRFYEITAEDGSYAKFYITEEAVDYE